MAVANLVKTPGQMSSAVALPCVHAEVQSMSSAGFTFPLQGWSPSLCRASFQSISRSSPVGRNSFRSVRRHAKFEQFNTRGGNPDGQKGAFDELPGLVEYREDGNVSSDEDERDDRVLPDSLEQAVIHSSESTALFLSGGGTRAVVELLVPQLQIRGEEGDQLKVWNFARLYLDDLQARLGTQQIKAVFPDAGVAAMLKYRWKDSSFSFSSLGDRKPFNEDDDVVVLVSPDYQMLGNVEKIAASLVDGDDGPPRPLVMWNPALQSGEVGIGLNVRRMRESFLSTFSTVYSMRSLSFGAIFRRYPGNWQVFFDDDERPGRYLLVKVEATRPILEDVEMQFMTRGRGEGGSDEPAPLQNALGVFSSLNRFMRSLSR